MNTKASVIPRPKLGRSKDKSIRKVGFLGLGIMGSAMAVNLIKSGFEVCGFDPSSESLRKLKKASGVPLRSVQEVAGAVDVIITSLPSPAALRACTEGLLKNAREGLLIVETSTLDIKDKQEARIALEKVGIRLLDCPLSGTGAQARNKDLTVYASGQAKDIKRLGPVFDGFSKAHFDLGEFGNGMKMKLMANLLVAIHNVSTAEALLLGERFGIPIDTSVKVLSDGAGGSRMLQVRGPMMKNEGWQDATMKIDVWQKDMKLIAQALVDMNTPAPLFNSTVAIYNAAIGIGHGQNDTAAVYDVLQRMSSKPTKKKG
jgi:L-threonate 2-dehydrogenase